MRDHETQQRRQSKILAAAAVIFAVLAFAAFAFPTWIERTSGMVPDGGSGELEAFLAIPAGLIALVLALLAIRSRRHMNLAEDAET